MEEYLMCVCEYIHIYIYIYIKLVCVCMYRNIYELVYFLNYHFIVLEDRGLMGHHSKTHSYWW